MAAGKVTVGPPKKPAAPKPSTAKPLSWNQAYGPGSNSLAGYATGQTKPYTPPQPDAGMQLAAWWAQNAPQTPGENINPTGSGGGRGGGGGGGGGGMSAAQKLARQGAVDQAFTLNEAPYWQMQAALNDQRQQAQGYRPDFASIEQQGIARGNEIDAQRTSVMNQRMTELQQLGQTLAGQQGGAIAGAARDLGNQGFGLGNYVDQANQMGAARTGALANQGAYMGMLNQQGANASADYQRGLGTIRAGGEATFGNNLSQLYGNLDMQAAGIQQQAAQARSANDKAKLQYMLQLGLV